MSDTSEKKGASSVAGAQMGAHIADGSVNTKSADELMAEFDRESNTRQFTGLPSLLMKIAFLASDAFQNLSRTGAHGIFLRHHHLFGISHLSAL